MPVVLRVDGFVFRFFSREHDPPHVHVRKGGEFTVIELGTGRVRPGGDMRTPDTRRAREIMKAHRDQLLSAWEAWKAKREGTNDVAGSHG